MLHLFEATVSTTLMVAAEDRESAIAKAKENADTEIKAYSEVSLADINHISLLPDEWTELYPYIANACISRQMKCKDLVELIQKEIESKPVEISEDPEPSKESEPEKESNPKPPKPQPTIPSKPNKTKPPRPQPGRLM
jgi:hypothetical protein